MIPEMDELMESVIKTAEKNVKRLAKINKAYFDALLSEGFTRDEAIRILSNRSDNK